MHLIALILATITLTAHQALSQPPTRTLPTLPAWSTPTPDPGEQLPASCTYRPTATWYKTSGCAVSCLNVNCIADFPIVLPCGCTRAAVAPTTTTVCPTASGCVQCTTGWGIHVTTQTNCRKARVTGMAEPAEAWLVVDPGHHNEDHIIMAEHAEAFQQFDPYHHNEDGIIRYARPLQA